MTLINDMIWLFLDTRSKNVSSIKLINLLIFIEYVKLQ